MQVAFGEVLYSVTIPAFRHNFLDGFTPYTLICAGAWDFPVVKSL